MKGARRSIAGLWIASLATACSSTRNGTASLEARGGLTGKSAYVRSGSGQRIDSGGVEDLNVGSYGLRASINTIYVDLIAGTDEHRIEGQTVQESSLGLRKRFPSTDPGSFYVDAAFRRGFDLETASGRSDYEGLESGVGAIIQLDEHWFLDLSFVVEWTLGDLDLENGTDHVNEVLFNIGLGFSI